MNRRDMLRGLGLGAAAGAFGLFRKTDASRGRNLFEGGPRTAAAQDHEREGRHHVPPGAAPHRGQGRDQRTGALRPGLRHVQPADFARGRGGRTNSSIPSPWERIADNIEDLWQTAYTSSYWRNGPVLNNALSGLDQALWDIKGKRAGMPVYQLLGGKCRFAVDCYSHADGRDLAQLEESVRDKMAQGFRHVRIQLGGYGASQLSSGPGFRENGFGSAADTRMDAGPYLRSVPGMFEHIRKTCGEEIELLHDIHERLAPVDAIRLIKEVEPFRPFFIEDPFSPEDIGYFKQLRRQTAVPIAMGELFNSPHEWTPLITNRLIDFIRVHISQVGGLSVARKIAALAEAFGVRTAWHGPGDVSPVGHAANAHLDLAVVQFRHSGGGPVRAADAGGFSRLSLHEKRIHVRERGAGLRRGPGREGWRRGSPCRSIPGYWDRGEEKRRDRGEAVRCGC